MAETKGNEIRFVIERHLGVITEFPTGWKKELNLISWNDNPPKYDIRDWDPTHERMTRGITLHEHEMRSVAEMFFENTEG